MSRKTHGSRLSKVTLALGFVALLVGTAVAYRSPATGYELSIYAATPLAYWVGLAVAVAVSLAVSLGDTPSTPVRDAALLLAATSVASLVALPLIRGYYYYGSGDAMTHLGWTRDIVAGRLDPVDMLYPGIHTMTIFVSNVVGTSYNNAQMIVVLAFVLAFVAFVTLCVRMLGRTRWAVPVGLFSALLLLPINNVSVHLVAHPITQSLLFLPVVLYLVMKYVGRTGESTNRLYVTTPMGVLLALTAVATILVHPQGALNVVAILVAIAGTQFFFRRFRENTAINGHRPVYVPTVVAVVAFGLWAPRHERVARTIRGVASSLLSGTVPADEISQRSASLAELGGSIGGLFVKLFLVSVVFCALAGALIAVWYTGRLDDRYGERNALITYLIVALVPLTLGFFALFAASMTTQHFRYVGFIMVPITILGATALLEGARNVPLDVSGDTVRIGLAVCFLLLLPLPLATAHSSPLIYQPSSGVTQMHADGVQTAIERMDRDVPFASVRAGPNRMMDGIYGTRVTHRMDVGGTTEKGVIPGEVFEKNLTSYYEGRRYVPVTTADRVREVALYDGFRYSKRGFRKLRTSPQIDRVHSNGEYRLYLLDNGTAA